MTTKLQRISHLLLAELFALGAFVFGGLALLGGAVTWAGDSRQPLALSWLLVGFFAGLAVALARTATVRLRRALVRTS